MKTLACLLLCAATLVAEEAVPPPVENVSLSALPGRPAELFDVSDVSRLPFLGSASDADFSVVRAPGQPFKQAARVRVKRRTDPEWMVQLTTPPSRVPVRKGDVLFVSFAVRCAEAATESGEGQLVATLRHAQTFDSLATLSAAPGKEWVRLYLRTVADRDCPAQQTELVLHLGKVQQTLDFGGFVAANLGPGADLGALPFTRLQYQGRGTNELWRQQALARIESIRKGDLAVQVLNAGGQPVSNATVRVRMTRHAYAFGTSVDDMVLSETPDGRRYRETAASLFNSVTCPLDWSEEGWEHPETRLTCIALAQWARLNGFQTRGRGLLWPGGRELPKGLEALRTNPFGLRAAVDSHLNEVVTIMKPVRFDTYEVINEPRANHALMDLLGEAEPARWFKLVRNADPHPVLVINETGIVPGGGDTRAALDLYMRQIRSLLSAGAPLGAIGVQCHMGENLTPPAELIATLDRLATLKLPVHATAVDIAIDDEETQGDYLRDFLTAFFSHPATESVTQTGFWEGRHGNPRAALYTRDWRLKPSGKAYLDLVNGAWRTDETRATDRQGYCQVRGFLGDYDVAVTLPDGSAFTRPARITRAGTLVTVRP